ncbi:MAG: DUF6263 family protein [Vicinamibacterales bacterium]
MTFSSGDVVMFDDEFDLAASRGAADGDVAPVPLTVDAVRLSEATLNGKVLSPDERAAMAPQPGAAVCLLQHSSGLTILNSSTELWGTDMIGLLQTVTAVQVVVFPADPIGVGARWARTSEVNNDGAIEHRQWNYELVAVDDHSYQIRGTATFTQDTHLDATIESVPANWDAFVLTQEYEFSVEGRFDQPFPTAATIANRISRHSDSGRLDGSGTHTLTVAAR